MKVLLGRRRLAPCLDYKYLYLALGYVAFFLGSPSLSIAQIATSITPTPGADSLSTTVTQSGSLYNITGGTRAGTNLFHSFGNFSVGAGDTANFLNTPVNGALPLTSNILGRVTDGNVSNIFGTIQTTGYGNANLFLMNPAGFLFGANATVNVGGMVAFTSADYLRLQEIGEGNAGIFHADPAQASVLTTAPVAAFGFLGVNPAAITVQGSQFTVAERTGISLVGGNITIEPGTPVGGTAQPTRLVAPGGQINLASVASPGEVSAGDLMPTSGMTMGNISLSGALLDVSGNAAGAVKIRGGQFVMGQAVVAADTFNANGAPVAVDINATGNVSISTTDVPALTARTSGTGNAGEVRISSSSMDMTGTAIDSFLFSVIDTHTSGSGKAGNVNIDTGDLNFTAIQFAGLPFFIDSGTTGANGGQGGDINIHAHNFTANDTGINSGNGLALQFGEESTGSAGNISISADSLQFTNVGVVADAFSLFADNIGKSGNIFINVPNLDLSFSFVSTLGGERGGALVINTDHFSSDGSQLAAQTFLLPGGGITIKGSSIELANGSSLVSSTGGDGDAGNISITATDHLSLIRANPTDLQSGIFSNSFGSVSNLGNAGDITITTPRLEMTRGARINTSTATDGRGGNVTINADSINMSGEAGDFFPVPLFSLGVTQPSGIFTLSVGGQCSGPCGNAGNISISTGSLSMGTGSQINSGTSSSGQGGNITISAGSTIAMSGTLSTGQAGGIQSRTIGTDPDAGSGANISLTAGQLVTISNGAAVSASSTGPGNTGNIQIDAGQSFVATDSSVTTEATQAGGGTIKITTIPGGTVQLTNSTISASVLDGTGGGGSVDIDPLYVILQNSQILAQAVQGPGGNITISITNGGLFLSDANSVISASSQFGVNGTVTIQSPNAPGSGKIQPLGKTPLEATSLLNQHCAALAGGEFSSFTVAGRDSLPTEPGSWLTSPLYAAGVGEGHGVRSEGIEGAAPILSLRQIAPAGFLTQAFAVDWSAGCQS